MVSYIPLLKLLQRKLYTAIGSTNIIDQILLGILLFLLVGGIFAASLGIHLRQLFTLFHGEACITALNNIGGKDYSPRLCHEPIDVVYTWVNGSDPVWFAQMVKYKKEWMTREGYESEPTPSNDNRNKGNVTYLLTYNCSVQTMNDSFTYTLINVTESSTNHTDLLNTIGTNYTNCVLTVNTSLYTSPTTNDITDDNLSSMNRYRDNDELRYSVRSLFKYAPWIRYVHFVTNGQVPAWLDTEHPRVRVVTHGDIFLNQSHLPVFSSPAIEVHLHRIPGISNRFIYLNDDVFFGSDTWPDDFVTGAQGQKVYLAWEVPKCAPGCMDSWLGDGYCDNSCNTSRCLWDGGDCFNNTKTRSSNSYSYKGRGGDHSSGSSSSSSSTTASTTVNIPSSPPLSMDPCVPGCPDNWIGDKVCDTKCNYAACGWDGGDCGIYRVYNSLPGTQVRYNGSSLPIRVPSSSLDQTDTTLYLRGKDGNGNKLSLQQTQQSVEQYIWKSLLLSLQDKLENLRTLTNVTWLDTNRTQNITQLRHLTSTDIQSVIKLPNPSLFTITPLPLLISSFPINDTHVAVYANLTESINQMMHLHFFNRLFQHEYSKCKNVSRNVTLRNVTNLTTDQYPDQQVREDIECILDRLRTWSKMSVIKIIPPEIYCMSIDGADVSSQSLVRLAILSTQHKIFMAILRKSELQREQKTSSANKTLTIVNNEPYIPIHDINVWMRIKLVPNTNITNASSTEEWIKDFVTETAELTFSLPVAVPLLQETEEDSKKLGANVTTSNTSSTTNTTILNTTTSSGTIASVTVNRTMKESTMKNTAQKAKHRKLLEEEDASWVKIRKTESGEPVYESATVYNRARMDAWSTIRRLKQDDAENYRNTDSGKLLRSIIKEAWYNFAYGGASEDKIFGRKLTDTYGDSLVHTNRLITAIFGKKTRKVPAHMPHFIDVSAMQKIQDKWPEEFDATSSHRFRDSFDIQYAFAYFHFLMEGGAREGLDVETYFSKELDADGDGRLNENELRTLVSIVLKKSPPQEEMDKIRECLAPSEVHTVETRSTVGNNELIETKTIRTRPYITWESIINCQTVVDGLSKNARFAATHQEMPQDEVAFEMITDDYNKTIAMIDSIRARRTKFVCVNDDMKEAPLEVRTALRNFYDSFFHDPSPMELPPGVTNPHLHIQPLRAYHRIRKTVNVIIWISSAVIIFYLLAYITNIFLDNDGEYRKRTNKYRSQ